MVELTELSAVARPRGIFLEMQTAQQRPEGSANEDMQMKAPQRLHRSGVALPQLSRRGRWTKS